MKRFLKPSQTILLTALMSVSIPVSAQQTFPDIFEEIFKGTGKQSVPYGGLSGPTYVENIPVQVTFDTRADLLRPEATLIITAIAPPPSNVRRAKPLMMGETRMLISRLAPPLQMVIAVPSDMARDVDYALIEARIVDANGNTSHRLRERVEYSGGDAPFLSLVPEGAVITGQPGPQPYPSPQNPNTAPTPSAVARVSGLVKLKDSTALMRGSTLVVRVFENALAGGVSQNAISQERISIDQMQAPFDYEVFVPMGSDGRLESPEIEAYIEDWAARRTHVMRSPIPFSPSVNNAANVTLNLDSIITGAEAVPPNVTYTAPASLVQQVTGEATITAPRGLPAGSKLIVRVLDANSLSTTVEQSQIALDGMSGDVPFDFTVERSKLSPNAAAPLLSASIEDSSGQVLLSSRTLVTLSDTPVILELQPTALY